MSTEDDWWFAMTHERIHSMTQQVHRALDGAVPGALPAGLSQYFAAQFALEESGLLQELLIRYGALLQRRNERVRAHFDSMSHEEGAAWDDLCGAFTAALRDAESLLPPLWGPAYRELMTGGSGSYPQYSDRLTSRLIVRDLHTRRPLKLGPSIHFD